ncbi:T9SS-dependent M36 family metallopeptidase [Lacinutrix iliipiscaria]|uniref:T9SS-dependent M36 family metallopeptidase n=1 Tax=Lacinutrix iliipiscaria TaxID=1230532 RepID=A0ABW5WJ34_9FLAO
MKNPYLKSYLIMILLFVMQIGYAQNVLSESPNGAKIQSYLNQKKSDYNLLDNDIQDLYVTNEFFSKSTEITHVYVNQRFQGIKIHNAISSVAIKGGGVFYYANNFIGDIQNKVNTTTPSINPETAIARAVSHFELGGLEGLELLSSNGKDFVFSNGGVSKNNIPVSLVFTQTREGDILLSWDLNIHTLNGKDWWSARVDALTGEVIDQSNWILTCNFGDRNHANHSSHKEENTRLNLFKSNSYMFNDGSQYNVYALPVGAPNDGGRSLVSEPADSNASPFGWHDTNGVDGAEFNITRGNNVWVMEDIDGNDDIGYSVSGGASLNFDFPLNENQPPIGYQDASLTNLFYINNMMHDIWYQYGFDEASGNFQENNYGMGGAGSDFVFADGQDGSGLNNALFGTPPDGNNPGMTMFLWSPVGPPGNPLTINTGILAGDYPGFEASFGTPLPTTPITTNLALVDDSNATPDIHDACDPITNASEINGKIAVIRRGDCEFGFKILAAENAGAVAVIMVNNVGGDPIIMAPGAVGGSVTIPSIMINSFDGAGIINRLNAGETISATLISAGPYQRDGDLDNLIVAHEYTHGISNRLTGGAANTSCLGTATQMGEGWSDWFSLMITMKTGDLPEDPRGMATYAVGQPTNGNGIREAAYTTDFAVNNYTFSYTNTTGGQQHSNGFVWSTMLWDLTWAYIEKYGFDEDVFYGTGGNNKVMQVVMDGLKLQPCNPGFVTGRDAILAADNALTGGEDQCMIWEVFANRGLGLGASEGGLFVDSDQVEDFTTPPDTDPSLANCTSLSVDEFSQNDYTIYPNPTNSNIFIKTNRNFGEVIMTLVDINGRKVYSQKANLVDEVQLNISQLQSGLYILNIKGEGINTNDKIIKN